MPHSDCVTLKSRPEEEFPPCTNISSNTTIMVSEQVHTCTCTFQPKTTINNLQFCLAHLIGDMVHLPQCTEHIWGKKSWCDIQHLVTNQPTPYIAHSVHIVTHPRNETSQENHVAPVRLLLAGQSHHIAVAATVALQTNCYQSMKTCSLPSKTTTFITYNCVREYVRMHSDVCAYAHTTHTHNDNMIILQLWNIFSVHPDLKAHFWNCIKVKCISVT
jgi:hypothetical protein